MEFLDLFESRIASGYGVVVIGTPSSADISTHWCSNYITAKPLILGAEEELLEVRLKLFQVVERAETRKSFILFSQFKREEIFEYSTTESPTEESVSECCLMDLHKFMCEGDVYTFDWDQKLSDFNSEILTPIEGRLFEAMQDAGLKFKSQVRFDPYVVDFLIEKGDKRVVVEADGFAYHTPSTDQKRDKAIKTNYGLDTLRFGGSKIYKYADQCVEEIYEYLHDTKIKVFNFSLEDQDDLDQSQLRAIAHQRGPARVDPDRAQSGILVTLNNGAKYMFDCGAGTTHNMVRANSNPRDVGVIFLTHLHHDHICDFPLFAISGWMYDRVTSPIVLGPKGTKHFCDHLFEGGAYDSDFRARSDYPRRQANLAAVRPDVREVSPGLAFEDENVRIYCDFVEHIPREISECFGIRMEAEGKVIAFSGDTSPCDNMVSLAKDADVLFHECTFPESFIEFRSKSGTGTHAHTPPTALGEIAVKAGVKNLVATHFGHFESTNQVLREASEHHMPVDEMGPHVMDEVVRDIRRNYAGPLQMAYDLLRIDL